MPDPTTNPYLALLQQEQQPPGWAQILQHIGNLGFGLAGGFGQAAATGQPTMAAIGPGLMMGNQLNAQAAHQAEQERMKRLELQFQAQAYEDKRADVLRKQKALEAFAGGGGFNVAPQQGPLMGPQPQGPTTGTPQGGGYDTRVAGLEGGTKSGGMVFNELGSGAFGPYQFMPATWAAVRAQNPSLNLPADITQASREQHDAAHNAFKAGNAQGLQAAGFQPTPENLYLAHRFGLGGATSVLRADPDKPLAEVLPIDWQRQNPDMRGQTAGGFRRLAAERVGGSSVPYVVRPDAKPTQYSLMPDDMPLELPGGGMTLPRPRTAEPTFTAPVMPQPTWDAPSDIARVNPGSWFPPPAAPAPGQPPPVPGQPGQPPPAPGPGAVPVQYTPQPGTPSMAAAGGPAPGGIDVPPTFVPPPVPRLDPQTEARINAGVAGGIITPEKGIELKRQIVEDQYKKVEEAAKAQHSAAMVVYQQQQESRRHERGLTEQKAAEQRRLEAEGWELMTPQQAQMKLGPGYEGNKAYLINKKGDIKPVGGAQTVVNIDQKGEQEFGKEMGKMDAKRFGDIIQAEGTMNDMASKLGFALEQFKQTYTGPGAESANAFYKTLGAFGFEEAAKKANAADAAMAVVSQMKPAMRAPGTGSSSDRDMDTFARALPSLLNLPDGNERITAYFQRMADRATKIRELAQEHSDGGKIPLTRTGFDKAVKELGPLFTADEVKEMTALGKTKVPPPPAGFTVTTPGQATPVPPPPAGFTVRP